jgi:hypothetical protein
MENRVGNERLEKSKTVLGKVGRKLKMVPSKPGSGELKLKIVEEKMVLGGEGDGPCGAVGCVHDFFRMV